MKTANRNLPRLLAILFLLSLPCRTLATTTETYRFDHAWPPGAGAWQFKNLRGLCAGSEGRIYGADSLNHRIRVFGSDGRFLFEWGRKGTAPGEFHVPNDIAADADGRIFVADAGNRRIQIFDANGAWLETRTSESFEKPVGIAIGPAGEILVSDSLACAVFAFSRDGAPLWTLGAAGRCGNLPDELDAPHGLAAGPRGEVFVADTRNHRVLRLSPSGDDPVVLNEPGMLDSPKGVAVDAEGFVHVADALAMHTFSPDGRLVSSRGRDIEFVSPYGVTLDRDGSIWMSDEEGRTLYRFTAEGLLSGRFGPGNDPKALNTPTGLALDEEGHLAVVDQKRRRVVRYDTTGRFIDRIDGWTGNDGRMETFGRPTRIAADSEGRILVSDTTKRAVLVFSRDGEFLFRIGGPETDGEGLKQPWGIAMDRDGRIYVAEQLGGRIRVFRSDGTPERILRGDGLSFPLGVAVDPEGFVYVADTGNRRVVKLTPNDEVSAVFHGEDHGFSSPNNVGLDEFGNLFVTDQDNHRVAKLSPTGEILSVFGEPGSFSGQLRTPEAVVPGPDGRVFVADSHNHRIQVFAPGERPLDQKAILVAGGGPYPGNDLWDATRLSAHEAYAALRQQGFSRDRVRYDSADVGLDLDNNGLADDIAAPPSLAGLERAIVQWAEDAPWLILYLVNHGDHGRFRLGPSEILTAAQLSRFLDRRSGKTLVVIDACQAGSFAPFLRGENRIVVAGAGSDEPAHFIGNGAVSFSGAFWSAILGGKSVEAAFAEARDFLARAGLDQEPVFDRGAATGTGDFFIGFGAAFGDAPILEDPSAIIDPDGRRLRLRIAAREDLTGISRVWALLRPDLPTPPAPNLPVIDLPTAELARGDFGEFSAEIPLPAMPLPFSVAFYARSVSGNTAGPRIVRPEGASASRPVAVLVQGYAEDPTDRAALTRRIERARHAFASRGFAHGDVHVFPPGASVPERLAERVSVLAEAEPSQWWFYLAGSGPIRKFPTGAGEYLSPEDLAGIVAGLDAPTLIWDAPREGPEGLAELSGPERIVVAGFERGPLVETPAFSDLFWPDLARGLSVGAAFRRAAAFGWNANSALLDDDGDGAFNGLRDGQRANGRFLGIGIRLADGLAGTAPVFLNGQDFFRFPAVESIAPRHAVRLWTELRGPTPFPVPSGHGTEDVAREVPLPETEAEMDIEANDLIDFGAYAATVRGEFPDGRIAELVRMNLFQNIGRDVFEPDEAMADARPVTVNAGACQERSIFPEGDVDWAVFFGHARKTLRFRVAPLSGEGVLTMEIRNARNATLASFDIPVAEGGAPRTALWEPPRDAPYFLRIAENPAADRGRDVPPGYGLRIDHETAPFPGYVRGRVTDVSGRIIGRVLVRIQGGMAGSGAAVSSPADGGFLLVHPPGNVALAASADGYETETRQIRIPEGGKVVADMVLRPVPKVPPPPAPPVPIPPPPPRNPPTEDSMDSENSADPEDSDDAESESSEEPESPNDQDPLDETDADAPEAAAPISSPASPDDESVSSIPSAGNEHGGDADPSEKNDAGLSGKTDLPSHPDIAERADSPEPSPDSAEPGEDEPASIPPPSSSSTPEPSLPLETAAPNLRPKDEPGEPLPFPARPPEPDAGSAGGCFLSEALR